MIPPQTMTFLRRMLRIARTEIAALTALFIIALGILTFVEVADDMTEADGQAFDQAVLTWMQPIAGDRLHPAQHRLVEGLSVGLGHVVGDLDKGHHAEGDDEQGRKGGDLDPGDAQHAAQKGYGPGGRHRSLTVPLV